MRVIVIIFLLSATFGCESDHILIHAVDEYREVLSVAVNNDGEVFVSNSDSHTTLDELPREIRKLLESSTNYSFVIHTDGDDRTQAEKVKEILDQEGVERDHVAINKQA